MTEVAHSIATGSGRGKYSTIKGYSHNDKLPGRISAIFEYNFCKHHEEAAVCKNGDEAEEEGKSWRDIISIVGNGLSVLSFAGILTYNTLFEPHRLASRGKRDQFGVISSKLFFHIGLFGG